MAGVCTIILFAARAVVEARIEKPQSTKAFQITLVEGVQTEMPRIGR